MQRRTFLSAAVAACAVCALPRARAKDAPWRVFELRTELDLTARRGPGRVWVPLPQDALPWQRSLGQDWGGSALDVRIMRDGRYGAPVLTAAWGPGSSGSVSVLARVAVRDRAMAPLKRRAGDADAAMFLQPTASMPVDGLVAERAREITGTTTDPLERARAIYDWIVDNTFRDPAVRGCGTGDIRTMLETGNLGGKCADINALFVGLARAAGIPAREVYGVRVAPSAQFPCLGKPVGDVSGAQHCRAEFFVPSHGWVGVDPADVRKAVLEEQLTLDDPRVKALRERLFGQWEMNWVGYNHARDFQPDPPARAPLPYLMYPYAEFGQTVLDGRDAAAFSYTIRSKERPA